MSQNVTVNIQANTKDATKNVDNLNDALEDTGKAANQASNEINVAEGRIKALGGAINLVGGSVEVLAGGLALSGALTEEQAERFEAAAVGALVFADGTKRVFEGVKELKEGIKLLGGAQKIATVATKAFGIATKIAMGPVGIAILAIGLITTAIILLKDKFEIINKVATFFGNIISKVAQAIGLGKSETEKFAEAQGKLAKETEFSLKLLQAQGASTDKLIKKERELLKQRVNSFKKGTEERIEAEQELALFEAKVIADRAKLEGDAEQKRRDKIKENAEKRKQAILAAQGIINEAELALLDEQTRELTERETQYQADVTALKAAGFTDLTAVTEAYNQDIAGINGKYRQEELDAEAEQSAALEAERQQRIDSIKSIDDFLAISQEEKRQLDFQRLREDYLQKKTLLEESGVSTLELEEAYGKRVQDLRDQNREEDAQKDKAYRQTLTDLAIDSALGTLGALSDLNQLFDKDNEEAAKRAFQREKALNIAETIISTYSSAQKAFASQLIIGDPTSVIRAQIAAGVAIAGGLARLAVISAQKFNGNTASGGTGGGAASGGGGGGAGVQGGLFASTPTTPEPPTPTAVPQTPSMTDPVRAYVLVQDVNSAQAASATINRRRSLTG